MFVDESQVSFQVGPLMLTSRLIEGEFPNYRQLLPRAVREPADGLAPAADRRACAASACSPETPSPVRLEFNALGVKLSSSSPDLGQAVEAVEARYEGEDITAAFNPSYLADGLAAASGESVRLEVRDGLKPGDRARRVATSSRTSVMPVQALPTPVG